MLHQTLPQTNSIVIIIIDMDVHVYVHACIMN